VNRKPNFFNTVHKPTINFSSFRFNYAQVFFVHPVNISREKNQGNVRRARGKGGRTKRVKSGGGWKRHGELEEPWEEGKC
jgi:hypothetical protein